MKSTIQATISTLVTMAQNKFVGITFVKKDGTTRRLNGRFNVRSKTSALPSVAKIDKYVTIYDVKNAGFRNINLNTVRSVRTGGIELFIG